MVGTHVVEREMKTMAFAGALTVLLALAQEAMDAAHGDKGRLGKSRFEGDVQALWKTRSRADLKTIRIVDVSVTQAP